MRIRTFLTSLVCITTLSFGASAAIRPEVGQPLQEALQLAAAHNYEAAMARVEVSESKDRAFAKALPNTTLDQTVSVPAV